MRWITGSCTVRGRSERTRATASLTSLTASAGSVSSRKSIVVVDSPSVIEDAMCRTPEMPATAFSTIFVTCVSISAGAAPNCGTATETIGRSTLGAG
jgi:hypothetical protein